MVTGSGEMVIIGFGTTDGATVTMGNIIDFDPSVPVTGVPHPFHPG